MRKQPSRSKSSRAVPATSGGQRRSKASRKTLAARPPFSRVFPPSPELKGRSLELRTLASLVKNGAQRLALVGAGGSGKSSLACALGHRCSSFFEQRIHWFRVGAWNYRTLTEMLCIAFGMDATGERGPKLREALARMGRCLIVLDNHENDQAVAELMNDFADSEVCFVITARRCLLSGILVYPVTPPLVTAGLDAFPRVSSLTRLLRWSPLALDIADGLVETNTATAQELAVHLREGGAERVAPIAHEDDLPEVSLLVDWVWPRLSSASQQLLAVLAHLQGDHAGRDSLQELSQVGRRFEGALDVLLRLRLVQEPIRERYALHAVVRYAVARRTEFPAERWFEYYVALLQREPGRLALEQTHWFAAMDHAYVTNDFARMLRIEELGRKL